MFEDSQISGELLIHLSDCDLLSVGVTKLGHRRRLSKAIRQLTDPTQQNSLPLKMSDETGTKLKRNY